MGRVRERKREAANFKAILSKIGVEYVEYIL
jgi:hypothetical protein